MKINREIKNEMKMKYNINRCMILSQSLNNRLFLKLICPIKVS